MMPLPVSPGMSAPNPNEYEDNVSKWDKFLQNLTSPGISNSLVTAGLNMLTDRQPGESNLSHGAKAVASGLQSYEQGRQQQFKDQQAMAESARRDRGTAVSERGAATQEAQQAETVRHNKASEENERARITANKKYYDSLYASAKAKMGLSRDDALNRALETRKAQFDAMGEQLANMMPDDPNYGRVFDEWMRIGSSLETLVVQTANVYGGTQQPGSPDNLYTPEMADQIRQDPRYNPTVHEPMLRGLLRDKYVEPALEAAGGVKTDNAPATPAAEQDGEPSIEDLMKRYAAPAPKFDTTPSGMQGRIQWDTAVEDAVKIVKQKNNYVQLDTVDEATLRTALHGDLNKFERRNVLRALVAKQAAPVTGE